MRSLLFSILVSQVAFGSYVQLKLEKYDTVIFKNQIQVPVYQNPKNLNDSDDSDGSDNGDNLNGLFDTTEVPKMTVIETQTETKTETPKPKKVLAKRLKTPKTKKSKPKKFIIPIAQVAQVPQEKSCKIISTAKSFLGVKYRYGGESFKGIDCSSFVQKTYRKSDYKLPRTSYQQSKHGKKISKKDVVPGDLLFFNGEHSNKIGHVGIVVDSKKKLMIHASSGAGKVVISNYEKSYYRNHYRYAKRLSI